MKNSVRAILPKIWPWQHMFRAGLRLLAGLTALTMGLGQERAIKEREAENKTTHGPEPTLEENALPLTPSQARQLGVPDAG
jgi:hypothetical protein